MTSRALPVPTSSRPARRPRARGAALLVLLATGCGGASGSSPRPTAVVPDRGSLAVPVAVRIRGEDFVARVTTDFANPAESTVDAGYRALLGNAPLQDVTLNADGDLTATVPAGLASGIYDLTVIDPRGRSGALPRAYRVLSPGAGPAAVARFQVDAIGPQEAFGPFMVSLTALDAAGAVATGFNGAVRVSDLTGTAVPATAARFVAGRWSGLVEVRAPHAGDVLAVADELGATGTSAPFVVASPPATAVSFTTPPVSTAAGRCAGPITLSLQDRFGVPATAAGETALALSASPPDGVSLFADSACATVAGAPTLPAGEGAVSLWFVATHAGPVDLGAAAPGLRAASQRETVAAGAPATIAFVSAPQAVNAGACSQAATIEVRDASGNPSGTGALALSVTASPAGALALSASPDCAGAAPTLAVNGPGPRATFYFSATTAGAARVTVTGAGLGPGSQDELVTPAGSASRLVFLSPARGAAAGACSDEVSLQAQDSFGNPVSGAAAVSVALAASPSASFVTYSDAACTTPAAAIEIAAGRSAGGFRYRGTLAAAVTVTATASALTGASQVESVGPAPASQVAFSSAPQAPAAGSCSGPVALAVTDPYGNASPVGAPLAVALAASPADGFEFFLDASCTSPASGVAVPAGASTTRFHFKGSQAGAVTVSAKPDGLPGASQVEQLRAAAAQRLVFTTAPQTVAAGACSAAASVEVRDALGNVATLPASALVSLSAAPSTGVAFFRDAACAVPIQGVSIPAGGSGATFYFSFSATSPGTITVTAAAAGLDPAAQAETARPALPVQLAFASAALTVGAGACSAPITLEARDPFGNPSAVAGPDPAAITLAASPTDGVVTYAGAGCGGAAITTLSIPAGERAVTFSFRSSAAGHPTLTATSPVLATATQTETVTPQPPDRLVFQTAAATSKTGACSAAVTLEARDGLGNPSPVTAATSIALTATPASLTFFADAACATAVSVVSLAAGEQAVSFRFRGEAAGAVVVAASGPGLSAASQTETIVAGAPDHLTFTSSPQTVVAGACSGDVTLQAQDAAGNPAAVGADTAVALTAALNGTTASGAGGISFFAGSGCAGASVSSITLAAGTGAATFSFRTTASGTVTVTAAATGLSPSPSQAETIRPGAADHLAWGAVASPQASGVAFPVAVTARDAYENVAASFTGTATLSASTGAVACDGACTSSTETAAFVAGVWTGRVVASPAATGVALTATSGSVKGTSASFTLEGAAARSPPSPWLSVNPTVVISGNAVAIDASWSTDAQTAAASLEVSWDLDATSASRLTAAVPPASPWGGWTTVKKTTHAYFNNSGTTPLVYRPRVAVRDTQAGGPDVAYASATVVVLPNGNGNCTVNTSSDVDDGATSCQARGTDGLLSFREALRLANAATSPIAIDFASGMTIASTGTLSIKKPVFIVAPTGAVALQTATLDIAASGVLIAGLELSRPASPVVIEAGAEVTLRDVRLHDGAGLLVKGKARVEGLTADHCAGSCVEVNGADAYLALFDSELLGTSLSGTGLALTACASATWSPGTLAAPDEAWNGAVVVAGNVFSGFGTAVSSSCSAAVLTSNTFVRNATAVRGIGAALLDSIFSGQTDTAVTAATCPGFATSARHVVWQNANDGCLAAELSATAAAGASFSADPRFVWPGGGDYRLQTGSPARDLGAATNLVELDGAGPGRFLGANPDRGGRETY